MKTLGKTFIIFLPLLVIIIPFSCHRNNEIYNTNIQSYTGLDDFSTSESAKTAESEKKPGNVNFNSNHLFVEEKEGMYVKNNMMYIDSSINLSFADISNANILQEFGQVKNVFPYVQTQFYTDTRIKDVILAKGIVAKSE